MTPEEPFLRAIADADGDDVWHSRLIYADWLEEQGDERAELLRMYVAGLRDRMTIAWRRVWEKMIQCDPQERAKRLEWLRATCPYFYVTHAHESLGKAVNTALKNHRYRR